MASPAVTYTFSNSTTADATQVTQNFTDLINGMTDGSKDFSISALTLAGNLTVNGNTTIGNASSDSLTLTASLASSIPLSLHNTYDIGSVTSLGLRAIYFASSSATKTAKLQGPAVSSDVTITLPAVTGTLCLYTAPTVQTFTSSTGNYTTPANVKWIRVRMIGGGGGGGGSGSGTSGGTGVTGGTTTFGTTLLSCVGGGGGKCNVASAAGGTASLGSGPIGLAISGATGGGGNGGDVASFLPGMSGAASPFAGGGAGGGGNGTGSAALTNSGAGGGGAGGGTPAQNAGGGGSAGGYVDAIIFPTAAQVFAYAIGAAGTAGTAGTNGFVGGAGGSGYIIVEEFYG